MLVRAREEERKAKRVCEVGMKEEELFLGEESSFYGRVFQLRDHNQATRYTSLGYVKQPVSEWEYYCDQAVANQTKRFWQESALQKPQLLLPITVQVWELKHKE